MQFLASSMDFHRQGVLQEAEVHPLEEYDDDVFYGELRKQILQLTAEDDDDEEDVYDTKVTNEMQARKQGPFLGVPRPVCYHDWPAIKEDCGAAAPAWIVNLWRSGNGTGVFIPQGGVQSRRKNRSRRKNGRGRTSNRRVERMN